MPGDTGEFWEMGLGGGVSQLWLLFFELRHGLSICSTVYLVPAIWFLFARDFQIVSVGPSKKSLGSALLVLGISSLTESPPSAAASEKFGKV